MTINKVFQDGRGIGTTQEQNIVESNTIEIIQTIGQEFIYLPRTAIQPDPIFHEDVLAQFISKFPIEMYIESTNEYGGSGYNITELGMQIKDNIQLIVAKKRIAEALNSNTPEVPQAGDLLYWPLTNSLWQITNIDSTPSPMYVLSNLYVIRLECSRFSYSYELFATGIPAIDNSLANYITPFAKNTPIATEANEYINQQQLNPQGAITDSEND